MLSLSFVSCTLVEIKIHQSSILDDGSDTKDDFQETSEELSTETTDIDSNIDTNIGLK